MWPVHGLECIGKWEQSGTTPLDEGTTAFPLQSNTHD